MLSDNATVNEEQKQDIQIENAPDKLW